MLRLTSRRAAAALLQTSSRSVRRGVPSIRRLTPSFELQHRSIFSFFKDVNVIDKEKVPEAQDVLPPAQTGENKAAAIDYSIGKYAKLADGSVMARWGNSMVLATVVSEKTADDSNSDFLPLMVDYREKYASTGVIPGSAKRREMAGTDAEVLKSRIVDRIVRPLFPKGYNFETQIIATVQSYDVDYDPVVLAVNSTSAALVTSNVPWNGPIGCVRVVRVGDNFICNPTVEEAKSATMNVLYAGTAHRTLMIEAEGHEIPEATMQEALRLAHENIQPIIAAQLALPQKPKREVIPMVVPAAIAALAKDLLPEVQTLLGSLETPNHKKQRQALEGKCYDFVKTKFIEACPEYTKESPVVNQAAHELIQDALRTNALSGVRLDGRGVETIRDLEMETSLLPSVHGSSLFSRGDTQALCTVTVGSLDQSLRVRSALNEYENYEMRPAFLQYEFPPFCVNETGKLGGPNRRMIGHGALAEKAILPLIPPVAEFPHAIRMTAETMGSDGSSSMATVCGVTLALRDAGVPIKSSIAGISIGLVTSGNVTNDETPISDYRLLTDILGTEDHYGDMDFKIAGTANGITAMQLDVKLPGGVPVDILCQGIDQAKRARSDILDQMNAIRVTPRSIETMKASSTTLYMTIDPSMRGVLIGTGGSTIRELESQTGCSIQCKEDGLVEISGKTEDDMEHAKRLVERVTFAFRRNKRYRVVVQNVMDFGCTVVPAFAYGMPLAQEKSKQGFLHITEMAHSPVKRANAVVQVGQTLDCWCIFAERDLTKLSLKALIDPKTEKPLSDEEAAEQLIAREEELKRARKGV
ncbi:hypothetical protein LEN26_010190 [Aphanomyces euteiches]|nr:hypothetical protein AeMF1_017603 [Aphanomyces euteiches]KAH9122534.1 hypothetical protein LEN26_010190 [Aphanomyces euteiches]KAH9196491.1 hypothetical protein AeNC1_001515 [Aphanomyces euteiches]